MYTKVNCIYYNNNNNIRTFTMSMKSAIRSKWWACSC